MLRIFKRKTDIPEDMELVVFNDSFFNRTTSRMVNEDAAAVIAAIDKANLKDKFRIVSRFENEVVNIDRLSTGCKTALNVFYFPDKVFSLKECGDNALDVIYGFHRGCVFCEYPVISFEMEQVLAEEPEKSRIMDSYEELKEWWQNV